MMDSSLTSMSLKASKFFAEERIRVGKEEAGTSAFNQAYYKFPAKPDTSQSRQLLEMDRREFYGHIKQWQLIMIISIAIQNITSNV